MRRVPLWVFFLPFMLGLPFIGRTYFVDDHYQLLMARGLWEHPTRPYDFIADDDGLDNAGWERGQPPRMVNPPLHHYMMAILWKAGGGRLWVVRLGMLAFSALAAVFLYLLAQRFVVPPGPVVVLSVLTPAFWVSSYGLLIDSTLLTYFLAALWCWIEGVQRPSGAWRAAGGVLMGAAILTKYTGGFVVPLAALYWWMESPRPRRWRDLAALLLPAAMLGLWSLWNVATYGAPHLTESSKRVMQSFAWSHLLVFLTFFSGVFGAPVVAWAWSARRGRAGFGLLVLAAACLALWLSLPGWGGFDRSSALLMAFLSVGGLLFFRDLGAILRSSRVSSDRFLAAWLLLGSLQMIYVMQWVAARYYLTILPPMALLLFRRLELLEPFQKARRVRATAILLAATGALGLCVAIGDILQAETARSIAADVRRDGWEESGRRRFFLGDSFTASGDLLKSQGWVSAFEETVLKPGDLILSQQVSMPRWWFHPRRMPLRPLRFYAYTSAFPLRVMENAGGAGFYASAWGPLPFVLTRGPLERYTLFEVLADCRGDGRRPHEAGGLDATAQ